MICAFSEGQNYPCGKCFACRQNKQRKWLARLLMESRCHEQAPLFVTLTYRDEEMPTCLDAEGLIRPTILPEHLSSWIRTLRRRVVETTSGRTSNVPERLKVRFYGVGEYGTKSGRPHYHAILFGATDIAGCLLAETWSRGFVTVRPADAVNMRYTLKYVLKDLYTKPEIQGQHAPFARMSLRPPIGAGYAKNIAASLNALLSRDSPGPGLLHAMDPLIRIDGQILPLDRSMRRYIRRELLALGMPPHLFDEVYPPREFDATQEEVEESRKAHRKAHRQKGNPTLHPV